MTKLRRKLKLSTSQEDYLKALYHLGASEEPVQTSVVAARLGVSSPSVTEMLNKLALQSLVAHDRYHGTRLTPMGVGMALEMVRHHRLLEMYLTKVLGYTWDEVHEEAEHLEHAISERLEDKMFAALGKPDFDPHGDPIPTLDGRLLREKYRALTECASGDKVTVRRVSDREPDKLRALAAMGLTLGARLEVIGESRFEGPIEVRTRVGRKSVALGLARAVFVA